MSQTTVGTTLRVNWFEVNELIGQLDGVLCHIQSETTHSTHSARKRGEDLMNGNDISCR